MRTEAACGLQSPAMRQLSSPMASPSRGGSSPEGQHPRLGLGPFRTHHGSQRAWRGMTRSEPPRKQQRAAWPHAHGSLKWRGTCSSWQGEWASRRASGKGGQGLQAPVDVWRRLEEGTGRLLQGGGEGYLPSPRRPAGSVPWSMPLSEGERE